MPALTAFAVTSVDPSTLTQGDSGTFDITGAGFAPATGGARRGQGHHRGHAGIRRLDPPAGAPHGGPGASPTARHVDVTTGVSSGATVSCPACLVTIVPSVP